MSQITQNRAARNALEQAISGLVCKAVQYHETGKVSWALRELLAAGREYGRALNRVEHMRDRK